MGVCIRVYVCVCVWMCVCVCVVIVCGICARVVWVSVCVCVCVCVCCEGMYCVLRWLSRSLARLLTPSLPHHTTIHFRLTHSLTRSVTPLIHNASMLQEEKAEFQKALQKARSDQRRMKLSFPPTIGGVRGGDSLKSVSEECSTGSIVSGHSNSNTASAQGSNGSDSLVLGGGLMHSNNNSSGSHGAAQQGESDEEDETSSSSDSDDDM